MTLAAAPSCVWIGSSFINPAQRAALMSVSSLLTLTQQGSVVATHEQTSNVGYVVSVDVGGVVSGTSVTLSMKISQRAKFGNNFDVYGSMSGRLQGDSIAGTLDGNLLIVQTGCRDCAPEDTYVNCTAPDHSVRLVRTVSQP